MKRFAVITIFAILAVLVQWASATVVWGTAPRSTVVNTAAEVAVIAETAANGAIAAEAARVIAVGAKATADAALPASWVVNGTSYLSRAAFKVLSTNGTDWMEYVGSIPYHVKIENTPSIRVLSSTGEGYNGPEVGVSVFNSPTTNESGQVSWTDTAGQSTLYLDGGALTCDTGVGSQWNGSMPPGLMSLTGIAGQEGVGSFVLGWVPATNYYPVADSSNALMLDQTVPQTIVNGTLTVENHTANSIGMVVQPGANAACMRIRSSDYGVDIDGTTVSARMDWNVFATGGGLNCYDDTAAAYLPFSFDASAIKFCDGVPNSNIYFGSANNPTVNLAVYSTDDGTKATGIFCFDPNLAKGTWITPSSLEAIKVVDGNWVHDNLYLNRYAEPGVGVTIGDITTQAGALLVWATDNGQASSGVFVYDDASGYGTQQTPSSIEGRVKADGVWGSGPLYLNYYAIDGILWGNNGTGGELIGGGGIIVNGGYSGKVKIVNDTYEVLDTESTIVCSKGTAFTVTIPGTFTLGRIFIFKNIGAGVVTLDPTGTDTIDGAATKTLAQWATVTLQYYAANAWIIL